MKNNKSTVVLAVLLLLTIIAIVHFKDKSNTQQIETSPGKQPDDQTQVRGSMRDTSAIPDAAPPNRKSSAQDAQSAKKAGPLSKERFSSTVHMEIAAGETLVTGGYQRSNGQYELTFITPSMVTLEDGSEAINLTSKVLSVDPGFIKEIGLEGLTTKRRNSLQHAEAWKQKKLRDTLGLAIQQTQSGIISSPSILAKPSTPATIVMESEGKTRFSIESTLEKSSSGGFVIKAVIERSSLTPIAGSPEGDD